MIDKILSLRSQIYYDFNISHFREKLKEIHGISLSYETFKFLKEEFLPWYNKNYTREVKSMYKEMSKGLDLDLIFSFKHFSQFLSMNEVRSFDRRLVEVCDGLDGSIRIFYEGHMVKFVKLICKINKRRI